MDEIFNLKYESERFYQLKNQKILIYGTGKAAKKLISGLKDFTIVGVLDTVHFEGEFCGVPVLMWDDVDAGMADALIIGSARKNYRVIFDRIQYRCAALDITIYGGSGQNLSSLYQMKYINTAQAEYFKKNEEQLRELIDQYDAVSFDVFDTLIMRKTLEPVDIFALAGERIKVRNIHIPDFKKKRRTAESLAKGKDIHHIYHHLREITGISEEEELAAKNEEINCEKQYLIPRRKMVAIMEYAIAQGKTVNLISDMYLTASILEPILSALGIIGYKKLYVSCDYGVRKGSGLFEIYRRDVGDMKCLHIGDNPYADVIAPKDFGIDSYEIKSALEMLKISSLRKLLICSHGMNNNVLLGLMLADVFNNPFVLYGTSGLVPVKSPNLISKLFIAPLVLIYMQTLKKITASGKYEGILFTARDGYLMKEIYDRWYREDVPSIYFMASRKLCLTAALDSEQDILDLCQVLSTGNRCRSFLKELLNEDLPECDAQTPDELKKFISPYEKRLRECSAVMRKNYIKYMDKLSVDRQKKYLLCDLNSKGTVQEALDRFFPVGLDGFYLCRKEDFKKRKIQITSVYDEKNGNDLSMGIELLEMVLTSPDPSVRAIDSAGNPVYAKECRTARELELVAQAQETILDFIKQYLELRGLDQSIDADLPEAAFGLYDCVKYEGDADTMMRVEHMDDIGQTYTRMFE